jgi:hypothetical protein
MLTPSKCVLIEYKILIIEMVDDMARNAYAKNNYELLCDCDIVLGLIFVLHVLKAMQSVFKMPKAT